MPNNNVNEIKKIARLSCLSLSDAEIAKFSNDFSDILKLVNEIQNCDTDTIAPMNHPLNVVQRLRPDEVTEESDKNKLQEIAPKVEAGLYLVPKVIES